MSDKRYEAWDGKSYPWPPPNGWYLADDEKWWPEGYGPKGDEQRAAGSETAASSAAKAKSQDAQSQVSEVDNLEASASQESPRSNAGAQETTRTQSTPRENFSSSVGNRDFSADDSSGGGGILKWLVLGVGVLGAILIALFLFGGGDDGEVGQGTSIDQAWAVSDGIVGIQIDGPEVWAADIINPVSAFAGDTEGVLPAVEGQQYISTNGVVFKRFDQTQQFDDVSFTLNVNGNEYEPNADCNALAGSLASNYAGDEGEGFLCWLVPDADATGGVLGISPGGTGTSVFFQLS